MYLRSRSFASVVFGHPGSSPPKHTRSASEECVGEVVGWYREPSSVCACVRLSETRPFSETRQNAEAVKRRAVPWRLQKRNRRRGNRKTATRRRCRQQRRWVEDGGDEIDDDDEGHNSQVQRYFSRTRQMLSSRQGRRARLRCCPAGRGDARGCAASQQHPRRRLGASTVVITTFPQRANQSQLKRVETCGSDDDDDDHDNDHDHDHDDRDHADDCLCDRKN
jgi:hypothetical protein